MDPDRSKPQPNGKLKQWDAHRTGRVWGITEEAFLRSFSGHVVPKHRMVFIVPAVAVALNLPDPTTEETPE